MGTALASEFQEVSLTGPLAYGDIEDVLPVSEPGMPPVKPTIISITGTEGDLYKASAGDWFSYDWPNDGGVDAIRKMSFKQTGVGEVTAINLAGDEFDPLVIETEIDIDTICALKGNGSFELRNAYFLPESGDPTVYESILKGGFQFSDGNLGVYGQKVYLLGEGTIGTLTVSSAQQGDINALLDPVDIPGTIVLNKDSVFGQLRVNNLVLDNGTVEVHGMASSDNKQLRGHGAWLIVDNLSVSNESGATTVCRKISVTGNGMLALGSMAGKSNEEIGEILANAELKCGTTKPTLITQGTVVALGGDASDVCIQIGSNETSAGIHVGKDGRWIYDVENVRYPNGVSLEVSPEEGYELYLLNWDGSEVDLPEVVPSLVVSDTFRVKYNSVSKKIERVFYKDLPGLKAREIVGEVEGLAASDVKTKLGVSGIYLQKLMVGARVGDDVFGHEVDSGGPHRCNGYSACHRKRSG